MGETKLVWRAVDNKWNDWGTGDDLVGVICKNQGSNDGNGEGGQSGEGGDNSSKTDDSSDTNNDSKTDDTNGTENSNEKDDNSKIDNGSENRQEEKPPSPELDQSQDLNPLIPRIQIPRE